MKKGRPQWAWLQSWAIICSIFFLLGCGGGGGGDNNSSTPAPNPQNPGNSGPNLAPQSVGGQTFKLQSGNGLRELQFNTDNTWTENGTAGNYNYQRLNGTSATVTLNGGSQSSQLSLTFANNNAGSYSLTGSNPENGTFMMQATPVNPGGGTNTPPNEGLAPTSIVNLRMFGTRVSTSTGPNGQTHVYDFSATRFHDSDPPEESDGNYTWSPMGDEARLLLQYTDPQDFNGDQHDLQMSFDTETTGTFTSTYNRRDGVIISIQGTFRFE
ncbi:MAG: hypothetical protein SFY81_07975 [Verrucomicrobiota bacterium]|nr:hypothetical protein [Verrucomicrobiota bacterium]